MLKNINQTNDNNLLFSIVWFILFLICLSSLLQVNAQTKENNTLLEISYPQSLKIIERKDWGWQPIKTTFKTHEIKYITVHHGGVEFNSNKNATEHVKNLQSWSRSEKQWIDIPYHFMIDRDGNIFEARPINIPGDTNTEYDPTSHILVEVMGNYEIQQLSEQQMETMVALIKFLSKRFNVAVDDIKTHKDYSSQTVCPGKNIYQYFQDGSMRERLLKK